MSLGLRIIQRCSLCGESIEEHKDDCPQGQLDKLYDERLWMQCPMCRLSTVELNAHDLFECCECHTQLSNGAHHSDTGGSATLFNPRTNKSMSVVILKKKGDGKFPLIDRIAAKEKEVEEAFSNLPE